MTQPEIIAMFSNNKFYPAMSTKTGKPYMSEDYRAHIFESASSADDYCKEVGNAERGDRKGYIPDSLLKQLSGLGFKELIVSRSEDDVAIPVPANASLKRNVYLSRSLLLLKETNKSYYLAALAGEEFIIPVSLKPRISKQFQLFRYGASKIEGGELCYLLFADMGSFLSWNDKHENIFQPLFLSFTQLERIRRGNACVIDPLGMKIYIGDEEFKLLKGAKKD